MALTMPWDPKKQSEQGKLGGRPKLFATKLREALIKVAEENADELAHALYDKAVGKKDSLVDVPAMKEIFDRGLGKALQNVDMTTNGESLNVQVVQYAPKPDEEK